MKTQVPSSEMFELLHAAAELRAAGKTWAAVAQKLGREEPTCRNWPCKYRRYWPRILAVVESQSVLEAGAEARAVLRNMLRDKKQDVQITAAKLLLGDHPKSRPPDKKRPAPESAAVRRNAAAYAELRRMTDDELDQHIRDFLADQSTPPGPAGPESVEEPE